ncbi:MAG: ABC transporter ATP-binding protein [Bryobacterales bacterium]|nr:ABC transporter ATP-binding protein [Bryobacterales bacterium]
MASIELRSVGKRFGSHEVVRRVDLLVEDREFVAFVGPSGSGKSTLLRMIAGLETVSEGEILIDGQSVARVPPAKRGLAMVFQSYAIYPHMTAAENMSFSLRLAGVPKAERDAKVREVARALEMEALLERKPRALSGGQLQRVALGRAMVRQPKAFLLDEPLSNLDAALQAQMRLELVRLHRELKTTMIYVTHDQTEAMTMADRIVVLNEGRVEQAGTPLELYNRPASLFVAGFIGAPKMNFLPAQGAEGRTLGVRPEHVRIGEGGELAGEIVALERLGARTYVHARLTDGTRLVAEAAGDTGVREGDRLAFRILPEGRHWFDGSGRRVT